MKKVLIVLGVILLFGALSVGIVMGMDRETRNITIPAVDIFNLPDGVYKGAYQSGRWDHNVEITVSKGKITDITNISKALEGRSLRIVEEAMDTMLAKQSVQIDVISGATLNTRAFQKAVANALSAGAGK